MAVGKECIRAPNKIVIFYTILDFLVAIGKECVRAPFKDRHILHQHWLLILKLLLDGEKFGEKE